MSIKFIDEFTFDVYIKKYLINNINLTKKEDLESYLKKLFKILNNKYNITIEGFYDIIVYNDKFYGIILHIEKEKIEYYDYYKNQVDMRLVVVDTNFKYEVDDVPFDLLNKIKIDIKNKKIYIVIQEELSDIEMMKLLEHSKIIYK